LTPTYKDAGVFCQIDQVKRDIPRIYGQQYRQRNISAERTYAVETLREKLIEMVKTLPEDRLQVVLDFINHINQSSFGGEDYDELQMNNER